MSDRHSLISSCIPARHGPLSYLTPVAGRRVGRGEGESNQEELGKEKGTSAESTTCTSEAPCRRWALKLGTCKQIQGLGFSGMICCYVQKYLGIHPSTVEAQHTPVSRLHWLFVLFSSSFPSWEESQFIALTCIAYLHCLLFKVTSLPTFT